MMVHITSAALRRTSAFRASSAVERALHPALQGGEEVVSASNSHRAHLRDIGDGRWRTRRPLNRDRELPCLRRLASQ